MPKPGSRPRIVYSPPEWGGLQDTQRQFGITETIAYRLMAQGKITSVVIRDEGKARGKRLINFASVRRYLARAQQEDTTLLTGDYSSGPRKKKEDTLV